METEQVGLLLRIDFLRDLSSKCSKLAHSDIIRQLRFIDPIYEEQVKESLKNHMANCKEINRPLDKCIEGVHQVLCSVVNRILMEQITKTQTTFDKGYLKNKTLTYKAQRQPVERRKVQDVFDIMLQDIDNIKGGRKRASRVFKRKSKRTLGRKSRRTSRKSKRVSRRKSRRTPRKSKRVSRRKFRRTSRRRH